MNCDLVEWTQREARRRVTNKANGSSAAIAVGTGLDKYMKFAEDIKDCFEG